MIQRLSFVGILPQCDKSSLLPNHKSCTGHQHRCLDNDEEAVQSQYRLGRCALRDGFVTISISVARFIEKRGKICSGRRYNNREL